MIMRSKHLVHHFFLVISIWTVAMLILFICDCWHLNKKIEQLARIEARVYLSKEKTIRRWLASHDPVYVSVTEKTRPDPFLSHVADRDILTSQGQMLTLMSPDLLNDQAGAFKEGFMDSLNSAYLAQLSQEITSDALVFVLLWALGFGAFWMAASQLSQSMEKNGEAGRRLNVAKENYQALVDNSLTGIYISQDYKIKFCNAKFAQMHGYLPSQLIGKDAMELIHPSDRIYVSELHAKRMNGVDVPEEYETRCVTAAGRVIWVQRRNSIISHDGRPAVLGNEIDITEKKDAEKALKASEAQLKRLVARLIRRHEIERKAIALEIHEDIAQTLSAIKMNIEAILAADARGATPEAIAMLPIIERIKNTIHMIRGLTRRLSPIMLDDLGIKTAIAALCREAMEHCKGSMITIDLDIDEGIIPYELKIVIYRVLEELLVLSSRYRKAQHWAVTLNRKNGNIELVLDETGSNMAQFTEENDWQMAMAVVHNHAEAFGGSLSIHYREENHKKIIVSWPCC